MKSLEDKTRFIKKAFDDERDALRKLTEEHQAAHEVRQKAYDEWFELKKEPGRKVLTSIKCLCLLLVLPFLLQFYHMDWRNI